MVRSLSCALKGPTASLGLLREHVGADGVVLGRSLPQAVVGLSNTLEHACLARSALLAAHRWPFYVALHCRLAGNQTGARRTLVDHARVKSGESRVFALSSTPACRTAPSALPGARPAWQASWGAPGTGLRTACHARVSDSPARTHTAHAAVYPHSCLHASSTLCSCMHVVC